VIQIVETDADERYLFTIRFGLTVLGGPSPTGEVTRTPDRTLPLWSRVGLPAG
jgi:hypothetical protein